MAADTAPDAKTSCRNYSRLLAGIAGYLTLGIVDPGLLRTAGNALLVGSSLDSGDASVQQTIQRHWVALSSLGPQDVAQVLAPALTLAALLSIDTLKTCLVIDAMTNTHHESNRELVGQGLGNIASAVIRRHPRRRHHGRLAGQCLQRWQDKALRHDLRRPVAAGPARARAADRLGADRRAGGDPDRESASA
jgi:hypothetical protein